MQRKLELDLKQAAFSRYGSFTTVRYLDASHPKRPAGLAPGLWIGGVQGFHAKREIFRVVPLRGETEVPFQMEAYPSHVALHVPDGVVEICLAEAELLRIRARGVALRLESAGGSYDCAVPQGEGCWTVNTSSAFVLHTLHALAGRVVIRGAWGPGKTDGLAIELSADSGAPCEVALRRHVGFAGAHAPEESFDEALARVAGEFGRFAAPYGADGDPWNETARRAAFLNWSCVVGPSGHFRVPAMLMSKNWMANVWSWDHAINALALGRHHPQLAWDQLAAVFDQQLPSGQLPDFVNDAVRLYNYVKPPIHGWIYRGLMERNAWFAEREQVEATYGPLSRWTDWWLRFRVRDGFGVPEYYHGNDSGWDNGTVFDGGVPTAGPDAAAFLCVQLRLLADFARRLDRTDEATERAGQADRMEAALMRLWDGRRFRVTNREGASASRSDSVFGCLPIVLGQRLPESVRTALASEIERHLTEWGLATEHPESPLFERDGYWRGPVWAPPTLIVVDGLRQVGKVDLAREIAGRFCRLCARSGFAENFDPITGEGLRDKAYTWTSSVFLELRAFLRDGL